MTSNPTTRRPPSREERAEAATILALLLIALGMIFTGAMGLVQYGPGPEPIPPPPPPVRRQRVAVPTCGIPHLELAWRAEARADLEAGL